MDLERDDGVGSGGLEHACHIPRRDGIVRFGAAVLARIAEIGHDRGHAVGPGILEGADEEQEPAQLVIGAGLRAALQALDDIDVGAAHRVERARLMLAILELPLLVSREWHTQSVSDGPPQLGRGIDREQPEVAAGWAGWGRIAGSP